MPNPKKDECLSQYQLGLQAALDALDVVGQWDWDIPNDCVYADTLVALLFNVDPDGAQTGAPLTDFAAGVHADDRARVVSLIDQCAQDGASYVAEYRVCSADGQTRWVLARGRFSRDDAGRPLRGQGIIVDITQTRLAETAYVARGLTSDTSLEPAGFETPLEQAADHLLAARHAVDRSDHRRLQVLLDMALLEAGKELAANQRAARRRSMQ